VKKGKQVWLNISKNEFEYHKRQYIEPYRSTIFFIDFLKRNASFNIDSKFSVLDIGTGGGANLFWLSKEFPLCEFTGIDISSELITFAEEQQKVISNTKFYHLDFNDVNTIGEFDFVISLQLLSWINVREANKCLKLQFSKAKKGIAMSSLFCEDDLTYEVKIKDYYNNRIVNYNIYSIPRLKELAKKSDFLLTHFERFDIDQDLPKPKKGLGTYTLRLQTGNRLQFSGCMNLPWHFLLFKKKEYD
jgi:SAM-dependent methyltransferase